MIRVRARVHAGAVAPLAAPRAYAQTILACLVGRTRDPAAAACGGIGARVDTRSVARLEPCLTTAVPLDALDVALTEGSAAPAVTLGGRQIEAAVEAQVLTRRARALSVFTPRIARALEPARTAVVRIVEGDELAEAPSTVVGDTVAVVIESVVTPFVVGGRHAAAYARVRSVRCHACPARTWRAAFVVGAAPRASRVPFRHSEAQPARAV